MSCLESWDAFPATVADPCPAPALLAGEQPMRRFRSSLHRAAVVRTCNYCGSTKHLQRACTLVLDSQGLERTKDLAAFHAQAAADAACVRAGVYELLRLRCGVCGC